MRARARRVIVALEKRVLMTFSHDTATIVQGGGELFFFRVEILLINVSFIVAYFFRLMK